MTSRITQKQIAKALADLPPPDMTAAYELREAIERYFQNEGKEKSH